MKTKITVTSALPASPRVLQVAGMFDYPLADTQALTWEHHLPLDDKPWEIGLIVGPSGAGKSLLARHLWGERVQAEPEWPKDTPILDVVAPGAPIDTVVATFMAVGLGSVPSWLRPHHVLSNGEQFRANMARALTEGATPVVIDEFTSVVDRQVAKIASYAVQKTIRRSGKQFVAVTCHYDVEDWLIPDWVYDLAAQQFTWRSVQPRPPVELEIRAADKAAWETFRRHHYMSGELLNSATCFTAHVDGRPVAFTSYRHFPHAKVRDIKMGHRLVVLPDWQGLGIASALETWLGEHLAAQGFRYRNAVAHPGMIRLYARSPRWKSTRPRSRRISTTTRNRQIRAQQLDPRQLAMESFEYIPMIRSQHA